MISERTSMSPVALPGLWELLSQARQASTDRELGFLLVNQTMRLIPYRQSVLWLQDEGVFTLSGVVQIEANAPHVSWVNKVAHHLSEHSSQKPCAFTSQSLPDDLAQEWADWWPEQALWIPSGVSTGRHAGASLWIREEAWSAAEIQVLQEWSQAWWHDFQFRHEVQLNSWSAIRTQGLKWLRPKPDQAWYRQRKHHLMWLTLLVLLFPVRQSVLATGELVPAKPVVIRSPLEGVIDKFHVQPNQVVQKGQALFSFEQTLIDHRLEVAEQALSTAQADYRQTYQLALSDSKAKAELALLAGKIEEKRAEQMFAADQRQRAMVVAPQQGVVLMDDPIEWHGKPVAVGAQILRIAAPGDIEVEAWVPLGEAIELRQGATVNLYLNASPLSPVVAQLRYLSYDAVLRPDGQYAYRLRAVLHEPTQHRVGLKGTARIQGEWTPLIYALMRRPLATLRTWLGV